VKRSIYELGRNGYKVDAVQGSAKQKWGKFTDDDLDYVAGTRNRLVGTLQEKYGITKEESARQAEEWFKTHQNPGTIRWSLSHDARRGQKRVGPRSNLSGRFLR